jgi:hypothetical protein
MIDYQTVESPFYEANKRFIEDVHAQLNAYSFSGWCNAYGYDVESKRQMNQLSFAIQLKKYQTTQRGMIVPINAHNNTEVHIEISGLTTLESFATGLNWFQSLLFGKQSNASTPLQKQLADFSKTFQPRQLKLKKGTLNIQFFNSSHSPVVLINELEKIV